MAENILLVQSNAVEGKDEELNRWYDEVHLPEILQIPGFVAGRRYEIAPASPGSTHRYLAVYEIDGDPAKALKELGRRLRDGELNQSDAIDSSSAALSLWHALGARVEAQENPAD